MTIYRSILRLVLAAVLVAVATLVPVSAATSSPATSTAPAVTVTIPSIDITGGPDVVEAPVVVTNRSTAALRSLKVAFEGPTGWTTAPREVATKSALKPGQSFTAVFQVQVPWTGSKFAVREFSATATYTGGDGLGAATGTRTELSGKVLDNLADARNNVGTTTLATRASGNFDGEKNSFADTLLAQAGMTPGATVEAGGARFTWPDVAPGSAPDNVTAAGQAVRVKGSGSRLAVLSSGSSFGASGTMTIYYTDGTSSRAQIGAPNWCCTTTPVLGSTVVAEMMGRHTPAGLTNTDNAYRVFTSSVPVTSGKQVDLVVLPSSSGLHIFDMVLTG